MLRKPALLDFRICNSADVLGSAALKKSIRVARAQRIDWLDTAKGLSIVLVVYWHVIMVSRPLKFAVDPIFIDINEPLLLIRMPLLFTLSGYLLAHALPETWGVYLQKQVYLLIWLYGLWTLIYTIVQRLEPSYAITAWYRPEIHLWFIWGLLIFRLLGRALKPFGAKSVGIVGAIVVISGLDVATPFRSVLNSYQMSVIHYSVFFFFALWFGQSVFAWIGRHPWLSVAAAVPATIANNVGFAFGLSVFGLISALELAVLGTRHIPALCEVFRYIGKHSLEIFILHFASVGPILRMCAYLPAAHWLAVPIATATATALSILVAKSCEPFAPWLFRLPKPWRGSDSRRKCYGLSISFCKSNSTCDGRSSWRSTVIGVTLGGR